MTDPDHTMKFTRADFLSEEDWQRAIREGGTFNLRGGFRAYVRHPMAVEITATDFDPVDLRWSVSFQPVEGQA